MLIEILDLLSSKERDGRSALLFCFGPSNAFERCGIGS